MEKHRFGHNIKHLWNLDDNITHLNHGSFGATPKVVLKKAAELTELIEKDPMAFFLDKYPELISKSTKSLANFVGAVPENLVFIENASSGINIIFNSLTPILKENDNIVYTNHSYPAVKNTIKYIAERTNTSPFEILIPIPIKSNEEIIRIFENNINSQTRIAVIDHITSPTAIIFPVKEIIEICRKFNTIVITDGAHCPGMIDLSIENLNPDFYVGNCHKWLFSLKGCALLWVKPEYQNQIHPLTISNDYGKGLKKEFEWIGTRNPTSWLTVESAIDFYNSFGFENIYNYNYNLLLNAKELIESKLGIEGIACSDMLGTMASFKLPIKFNQNINTNIISQIRHFFLEKFNIECQFTIHNNEILFRISSQIYNQIEDYERLVEGIKYLKQINNNI